MSLPPEMFRHWKHSHEEDAEGVRTYRPAEYAFPKARGRRGFEIKPDGEFIHYGIARGDGNIAIPGSWELTAPKQLLIKLQDGSSYTLDVLAVDGSVLKIKSPA
jgi:hypothetical protein